MSSTQAQKAAIVTGASGGIGAAVAKRLARDGFAVVVHYAGNAASTEALVREIEGAGGRAASARADVADATAVARLFDAAEAAFGGVDVLVNVAGTGHSTPLLELDLATWREVLATDLDGAFLCLQRAARRMVAAGGGGRIVNVTSVHEHQPRVGAAAYCAAKGGLALLR